MLKNDKNYINMEETIPTADQQILSILLDYIPIVHICNIIIDMKNTSENKETLQYHMNRWNSIALKYIKADGRKELSPHTMMSAWVSDYYRVDDCLDFFKETGISYQIRFLVLDILKIHGGGVDWLDNNLLDPDLKKYRDCTDVLYSYITNELIKLFAEVN